ncbi:hypothetical protein QVD17_19014 [Tagetes erecta]|uniref:Uncharacterized protein n=1 Tax=Tagetes erecta TaxID=13708 RepID=A0AAD8NWV4_TARER|nr:hypothetical protein QVD17_19014 [Tagetes erecta]
MQYELCFFFLIIFFKCNAVCLISSIKFLFGAQNKPNFVVNMHPLVAYTTQIVVWSFISPYKFLVIATLYINWFQ